MKNIGKIIVLSLCISLLSGCSGANFFDIQSAMSSPKASKTYQEIDKVVSDYMGPNVTWKYAKNNNEYAKVIKCEISSDKTIYLAFCQNNEDTKKIHILFLQEKNSKWTILKDDIQMIFDVKNVDLEDFDKDGEKEIIITDKNPEYDYNFATAYKYQNGRILNINIER